MIKPVALLMKVNQKCRISVVDKILNKLGPLRIHDLRIFNLLHVLRKKFERYKALSKIIEEFKALQWRQC